MTLSPPSDKTEELRIEGMHCTGCAQGIEKHLRRLGLEDASVDFTSSSARFTPSPGLSVDRVQDEIKKLGYQSSSPETSQLPSRKRFSPIELKFLFCALFTAPLLLHMVVATPLLHDEIFQLMLCIPVFAVGGLHFGRSALASLKTGSPNMDVLIILGSSSAFAYSLYGTFMQLGPDFLFYETAASIITLVLLGNVLEKRSVRKTTDAIEELSKLQLGKATRVRTSEDREILEEVDTDEIAVGDLLQVNSGDRISADGEVITGSGAVNESMVTGESAPVDKNPGDSVVGGTFLASGSLRFRASAVGSASVLGTIIRLVRDTQRNKPSIQRLADQVSSYFVPAVLFFASCTFLISYLVVQIGLTASLLNSVAVLVIACPCAMGLATPTAVMVGIGRAVRNGILIKGGDTLEKLAKAEQILFDKTGTLTEGGLTVRAITAHSVEDSYLRSLLAGIERSSSHPIARTVTEYLSDSDPFTFKEIEEIQGVGMKATDTDGNRYLVGSYRIAAHCTDDGSHSIYVLKNDLLIGTVDLEDKVKEDARSVIAQLHQMGLTTMLVSGDTKSKSEQVAHALGISDVYAEKLPHEKLSIIEKLQSERRVAFVGDGINDAPALAKATIGISLSNASEVAIQSAQVVLLHGELQRIPEVIEISRKTLRTIKQNLFWAFFYNVLAIPVAAMGYLNPAIAALAMGLSDVVVIGNSLRLRQSK